MFLASPSALQLAKRRLAIATAVFAGAVLLTGCGRDAATEADAESASDGTNRVVDADFYPVTADNCGYEVTVDSAPERVLTIKSSTLDMMLALGLSDRVVGASFLDGPVPTAYADAAADVEVLSDGAPGPEAVLAAEPDMVFAGWESNFSVESAGERAALDDLGVLTYVVPSACRGEGYQPAPLTFEHVFADITQVAAIFGVPEAGDELVTEQRAELSRLEPDTRGLTALWYSSGSDVPYVGAGIGAPQMVMDAVGLTNIAESVPDSWTSFGWEQVVANDPDVIILVDATWNTAESKIERLEANPATAELTAVREGRYLVVPFAATEPGVRSVGVAGELADQLEAMAVR